MGSFEVTAFSSMEELQARLSGAVDAGAGYRPETWPDGVAWLPAGATAADVAAGRVRPDARVEGPWAPSWPQIERELATLGKLMDVVASARAVGVTVREACWASLRGAHRATAWAFGVTDEMPLDVGRGPVTDDAIARVVRRALDLMAPPAESWDAVGVAGWLEWLSGARDDGPQYPPGC